MCPLGHQSGCHQPTACHRTVSRVWPLAVVSLYDHSSAQPARWWQLTCSGAPEMTAAGDSLAPALAGRGAAVVLDRQVLAVVLTWDAVVVVVLAEHALTVLLARHILAVVLAG